MLGLMLNLPSNMIHASLFVKVDYYEEVRYDLFFQQSHRLIKGLWETLDYYVLLFI